MSRDIGGLGSVIPGEQSGKTPAEAVIVRQNLIDRMALAIGRAE